MRHWWLIFDPTGNARGVRGTREEADRFIRVRGLDDGYAPVEYVPADQLARAVAIIRELVRVNDSLDGAIGDVRAALGDEAAEQLRAILGGR
jgi:hypothetical protein